MGQFIPIAIALAGTAAQQAETQRVERKQDQETAQGLLKQSRMQQDADRRVNDEVSQLQASTADDARVQRLDQYRQQLQRGRSQAVGGLETPVGGATFQNDASAARTGVDNAAATTAGLMARIDAPQLQRQDEAFGYGRLATDIDTASRNSRQQQFLDQLRLRAIRRRPEMDLLAGGLTAAGGAMGSSGGGMASVAPRQGASFYGTYDPITMRYA